MSIQEYIPNLFGIEKRIQVTRVRRLTSDLRTKTTAVRDKNNYKDPEYFERKVRWGLYGARWGLQQDKARSDQLENRGLVISLSGAYLGFLESAYTWGMELSALEEFIPEMLGTLDYCDIEFKKVNWASKNKDVLNYAGRHGECLGYLTFLVGLKATPDQVQSFLKHTGSPGRDRFFDRLLQAINPNRPCGQDYLFSKHYDLLVRAMDAQVEEQEELIRKFLDKWYSKIYLKDDFETHRGDAYTGYWCWAAAAVVMLFNIDDSTFRNHVNYPDELVAYYRDQI